MTGILVLWALILAFFLVYSPFYLLRKVPTLFAGNSPTTAAAPATAS